MHEEDKINEYVKQRKFLTCYKFINSLSEFYTEKIGLYDILINSLFEEIDINKRSQEKIIYLRSIIILITNEIPELQKIYKEQLKGFSLSDISNVTGLLSDSGLLDKDLARGINNINQVVSGKKTIAEGINDGLEDTAYIVKDNLENISKDMSNPNFVENMTKNTVNNISQGIKIFGNIMNNINDKIEKQKGVDNKGNYYEK